MIKFAVLASILAIINSKIIMTKDKWVADLITLAKSPSSYSSLWPYNVLLWDGNKWYCDSVNINKALFNGRNIQNQEKFSYQKTLSNTGDVNAEGFIKLCTDLSNDFTKLREGEPRILHLNGNIGAYLGKEITVSKGVINVVECTETWEGGVLFSYVDSNGNRSYFKGSNDIRGKWTTHGKPSKWVQY